MSAASAQETVLGQGDLSRLHFRTEYRSLKEDPAFEFYRPCLLNSVLYKRAAGYFRSSVYLVVGSSVIAFAKQGGKINLICSPELSPDDIDGISAGYARRSELIERNLIADIDRLLADDATNYATRVLATLIAVGALEIKLALRADRKGVYHEKIGIFIDAIGNRVSFRGSTNETWSGWHREGNFESIEVFCSWRGGLEATRVKRHEDHFDGLWSGDDGDVEVFPFPLGAAEYLKRASFSGLDEVEKFGSESTSKTRTLLPHQADALDGWRRAGRQGILEHATGSGKTFTAIQAIREHTDAGKPALVLVPSRLLLTQWADELRSELPKVALLLAGGGNNTWKAPKRLAGMTSDDTSLGGRIVLATMQTASTESFRTNVCGGDHLLVVADEVHQIGSPDNSKALEIQSGPRLGLSATPIRYGDPDGTQRLLSYFRGIVPPPFTLIDAIHAKRLVPYEYYPHPVYLTATEADEWKSITREISLETARQKKDENGQRPLSERAKLLLIKRSRIAKKAHNKIEIARRVLRTEFQEGQPWLIYCEDAEQLREVMAALRSDGLSPIEYHSAMPGDREATLAWFRSFGGPLVSIRCLDEGVDIPPITHALILASSQNPRQFIQRRGRVLRLWPGKMFAIIHDTIVVPTSLDDEPEQTSLLRSEIQRAIEFAEHAINRMAAAELRSIVADLGIEMDALTNVGVEEDDDGI